jgi:ABC-type transport system involved in Fe-S cluster assembly fused permease/ATPase subunit
MSVLKIALRVLKDWRVIVIAIAVILYLSFYISIVSYRKKPKKIRVKKKPPAPKQAEGKETQEKEEKPPA